MAKFSVFKDKRVFLLVLSVKRQCIWICLAWFVRIGIPFNIAKQGFVNFLRQTKGDKHYDMASF